MLAEVVALHDVADVEGFVNATINRFEQGNRPEWARIARDEREELVLEGIAIMYHLADRYEPRRGNHTQDGRFSGFAAFYLPKRLGEAWHRLHAEHRYVTGKDGKREWVYLQPALSIEGLRASHADAGSGDGGREPKLRPAGQWAAPPVPA